MLKLHYMKKILIIFVLLLSIQSIATAGKKKKPEKPPLSKEMVDASGKIINELVSHIKPDAFGKKWAKGKDEWSKKVGEVTSPADLGKVTSTLAKNMDSDSYKESWGSIKSAWNKKASDATNMKQIAILLKQLESHLTPTSYDEDWTKLRDAWILSLSTLK